jgi:hypothetical protein
MNRWTLISCTILLLATTTFAQSPDATEPPKTEIHRQAFTMASQDVFWFQDGPGMHMPEGNVSFRTMHLLGDPEVVRNAPYSATTTNESTQTLVDGNRIVNKSTGFVARDSQGRTRREDTLKRVGSLQVDAPKLITITDPQTHANYIVMPDKQVAKALKNETVTIESSADAKTEMRTFRRKKIKTAMTEANGESHEKANMKHEDLGTQEIEGVSCHGVRDTITIPAGHIGNEQPIVTTMEVWTSPDLHIVVLEKHNDPRFGETIYRLSSINRSEPDPSLFQIPAGYKTLPPSESPSSKQ